MRKALLNFFIADYADLNNFELRKVILTNAFLAMSFLIMLLFAYLNLFHYKNLSLGIIDILGAALSLASLIDYRLHNNTERAVFFGTLILFVFLLSFSIFNQNNSFGLIWTIFFPIFAITLNGHRKGFLYSLLFYVILFTFAYNGIGVWEEGEWDSRSFLRLFIASSVLVYVVMLNEIAQKESSDLIRQKDEIEQRHIKELERLSTVDALTSLYNRRKIDDILSLELSRAKRYERALSVCIFDIDDFKNINDKFGHVIGDEILIELSDLVHGSIRKSDFLGRWGGEEFIIIFPETSIGMASSLANKIKNIINTNDFEKVPRVTCSFGLSEYTEDDTINSIVSKADKALYEAKKSGKNIVKTYKEL
ncbi:GGDEF domain-containing protein [bacterium]|nr:GGDEF domain-containing protein [bacterium]MBU1989877.1 GGDEF domain-containing protein [bacterium]